MRRFPSALLRRITAPLNNSPARRPSVRLNLGNLEERTVPSAPPAPTGFTRTITPFTNTTPVAIPDVVATVTSTQTVSGVGTYLHDLDVFTTISHTWASDMRISLTSPAGTRVTLTSANGGSNDDVYKGTLWDDAADPGNPVPYASPLAASKMATDTVYANLGVETQLSPEEPLGAFVGENPNGVWTITIEDTAGGDGGTLSNWRLDVATLDLAPAVTASQSFTTAPAAAVGPAAVATTSTLVVAGAPTYLQKLTLQTFLTHAVGGEVDMTLTSPAGTTVTITTDNGSGANNFNGTVWDDDADPSHLPATSFIVTDTTYTTGVAKVTLSPEEALAAFIGEDPNGTWTLTISDDTANTNGGTLASWGLGIRGAAPFGTPTAIAAAAPVGLAQNGNTTFTFPVTFSDNVAIDTATIIGNNDAIRVTGPNGYSQLATFVSLNDNGPGSPRTATYSIPAPGGSFDPVADDGTYTIEIFANEVFDTSVPANAVLAGPIGAFVVNIPNLVVRNTLDDGSFGSLRQVITSANLRPEADVITFDPTVFNATTPRTINLQTALPQFTAAGGNLTIVGPGSGVANVRRDPALPDTTEFRVFNSLAPTLTISDLTISGGRVRLDGGGLLAGGTVYLDRVVVRDNTVLSTTATTPVENDGGGISMLSNSFLSVKNSTVSGNSATKAGGGIYFVSGGSLFVENSTISGNSTVGATTGTGFQFIGGGGIYFYGQTSSAPPAGFEPEALIIRNSTIANNTSADTGGGIQGTVLIGTLFIQNSTITGNVAQTTTAGIGGGGIAVYYGPGGLDVSNSIVSGNTTTGTGPDINSEGPVAINYSAIGDTTGFDYIANGTNLVGADLLLGPLANNGGLTQTILPGAGSPVLDAGSRAFVPPGAATDQRGVTYVRSFGQTDIGAVEVQPAGLPYGAGTAANVTTAGSTSHTFTVTFTDPSGTLVGIDLASITGNPTTAVQVTGPNGFVGPATLVNVNSATNGTPLTATYTFTPPGGAWDVFDRGTYSIEVLENVVKDLDGVFVQAGTVGAFTFSVPNLLVFNTNDHGFGSLRQTMADALLNPGADTITFDPTVFTGGQVIELESPLPSPTATGGALTIVGPGADLLTITEDPDTVLAYNFLTSTAPALSISGLTLTGFNRIGNGGALSVAGTTVLDGMVITGNNASVGGGGVFVASGAFLTVKNSTISGNTAVGDGGGVYVSSSGALAVIDSTISGNAAGDNGGGMYFFLGGSLLVDRSTIADNTTAGATGGGGLYFWGTVGTAPPSAVFTPGVLVIRNSTFSGNEATAAAGGAIVAASLTGTLSVQNSTLTGNTAATNGGGIAQTSGAGNIQVVNSTVAGNTATGAGGGINRVSPTAGTLTVANSIVVDNTGTTGNDIVATAVSTVNVNYSAVEDTAGYTASGTSANNLTAAEVGNLQLGPLADNGGPTQTMLPAPGSPLVDRGSNALVVAGTTTDQRGPGFDRVYSDTGTATVDVGAVEVQPPAVSINQATAQADPVNAGPIVFTVTFTVPVDGFDAADVDLTASTVGGTLVAEVTQTGPTTYTVSVTGMEGNGTVVASILAGAATEVAVPNAPSRASTSTDNVVTFDTLAPTATINQGAAQPSLTNVAPVVFDVVFSEAVAGFSGADIAFTGSTVGGTLVATTAMVDPTHYTVSVTGASGEGTVVASIIDGSYTDLATNLGAASTSTDNSVDFDNQGPTVTINQGAGQNDPTNSTSVVFDVVFNEPVTGFTSADVNLSGSTGGGAGLTAVVAPVGASTTNYTVTVTGMANDDVVVATVNAGVAQDLATNPNVVSTSTDNSVRFDNVSPTVTVNQAGTQADPTTAEPISFTVVFNEPVDNFTAADVVVGGTSTGGVASVTGSGTTYTVTVSGMTSTGTVTVSVPGANYTDLAGNPGTDSTSTDNTVQFDYGGSFVLDAAAYTVDEDGASLVITVSRTGGTEGVATIDFATTPGTATPGVDYTTTTGTLTFAAGVGGSQTFTIPILDDRIIELIPDTFDVSLSNPTDATAVVRLGTPSTATVTITDIEKGRFDFSAPVYTTGAEGTTATITVTRTNGSLGTVKVNYATSDGTAHSGGLTATGQDDYAPTTNTLTFGDGVVSQTFTIDVNQDLLNEGRETINLTLSNATDGAIINPAAGGGASVLVIAQSNGALVPATGLTTTDEDADLTTVKLTGGGTATVYRNDPDGDGDGAIDVIELSGTVETKSALVVSVKRVADAATAGAGKTDVGLITGTTLKSLSAKAVNLTADGVAGTPDGVALTGFLGSLTVGNVMNGADITAGASANVAAKTNITAGVIGDGTDITIGGAAGTTGTGIGKLTATRIGVGSITAPVIGSITTKGATKPAAVAGDLGSTVTVSGAGVAAGKPALGKVSVAGSILASADITAPSAGPIAARGDLAADIAVTGPISSVKAMRVLGSTITANSLGSLSAVGKAKTATTAAVPGDITGLTLTLLGANVADTSAVLGTFSAKGTVSNTNVQVFGNVTKLSALNFRGSNFYVGFDGDEAGVGTYELVALLKSVSITGATDAYQDSNIIASAVGAVTFRSVDADNGGTKFGVISDTTIKSLKVTGPTPDFVYNPFNTGTQGILPDFEIRVV